LLSCIRVRGLFTTSYPMLDSPPPTYHLPTLYKQREVGLADVLDRVLNKGVMIQGDAIISVADIPLIRLNIRLLISSESTYQKSLLS